jgi:carbonic anhydrase/acetyltransferase-like protein (isoleucine patch superfamily)
MSGSLVLTKSQQLAKKRAVEKYALKVSRGPSAWQTFRQLIGHALCETGQAIDRVGIRIRMWATTPHDFCKSLCDVVCVCVCLCNCRRHLNWLKHYCYYSNLFNKLDDDPVIYEELFSRHQQLKPLLHCGKPTLSPHSAFVAPCATLAGSVYVAKGASIFYGSVLRADSCLNATMYDEMDDDDATDRATDTQPWELIPSNWDDGRFAGGAIFVGPNSNVQDNCILSSTDAHCVIGTGVTVGHLAQIHSSTIGDYCLIGMGSVIQTNVTIETESLIAAGAVVLAGTTVGKGELWVGNPAKKLRDLTAKEREKLHYQSEEYVKVAGSHKIVEELGGNIPALFLREVIKEEERRVVIANNDEERIKMAEMEKAHRIMLQERLRFKPDSFRPMKVPESYCRLPRYK